MSPARLSAPKALRMLTAFVPVLSESSALGADRYFDYRIENYAEALSDAPVDHVIDTLGETEFARELSVLKPGGRLLSLRGAPNAEFARRFGMPLFKRALFALAGAKLDRMTRKQGKEYRFMFVRADGSQLRRVSKIVERRKLRPVIDSRCFALDDALELVAAGHPEGKVVIRMERPSVFALIADLICVIARYEKRTMTPF